MSVKGKIKRLNRKLEEMKRINKRQADRILYLENISPKEEMLENIVKFALTNHVGNLRAGMIIEALSIDKMKELKLTIDRDYKYGQAYILRVGW